MPLMLTNIIDDIYTAPLTGIYVFHWNLLTCDAAEMNTTLDSSHGPLDYGFISHVDSFLSGGNLVIARLVAGKNVWVKKNRAVWRFPSRKIFYVFEIFFHRNWLIQYHTDSLKID